MGNIFGKWFNQIQDKFIREAPDSKILVEAAYRRGGGTSGRSPHMNIDPVSPQAKTLTDWKIAIMSATDRENPNRGPLMRLNDNLMLDNHLASVIESRILYCQRSAHKLVNDKGEENKELSWLLERPWFDEMIYKVIFKKFQGTTLLGMFDLTPDGELAEIMEIPQSHFNTRLGIITENEGEIHGTSYREGPMANYVLQIGSDYELGMFEKLAPIVLAKKLGLGSWLDYIDKYGVPPLFITTDREDDTRIQELYNAAKNFKSNHFMVGRGQEKFEIGKDAAGSVSPFDPLMTRANDEMSKRVLGGSGITDEKSFVGSAEIQFRLAKDRFESDKLFFKYIFNAHIKPRLVKLSPVYAPLANHYFEWDDTETMSKSELIDAVVKLGGVYEIDPAYIEEQTGIPVIGMKYPAPPAPGNTEEPVKK